METPIVIAKGQAMTAMLTRKIVRIDEDKCNGCGLCVPSCAEGAIRIIDGKARLLAENLCDGLGNCLGACPQDAITIEERPAEAFDERALEAHQQRPSASAAARPEANRSAVPCEGETPRPESAEPTPALPCGCPGSMARTLQPTARAKAPAAGSAAVGSGGAAASELGHWPVQLALLPVTGPIWQDADLLLAADCTGFAMPDFHQRLLGGRTLAVACPKLDDAQAHVEKLAAIFAGGNVRSVTVARMEVPCCGGLERIVHLAMERAGRAIPLRVVTVAATGEVLATTG